MKLSKEQRLEIAIEEVVKIKESLNHFFAQKYADTDKIGLGLLEKDEYLKNLDQMWFHQTEPLDETLDHLKSQLLDVLGIDLPNMDEEYL